MKRSLTLLLTLCGLACSSIAAAGGGATVTYIYTDGQGSPVAEADSVGNVTSTFDYTPFGSTLLGAQQNGPGYTGHVADPDTSLTYMQARYYDPSMGQFLSVDPVSPKAGEVSSFGTYAYAGNNPATRTDPDGREWTEHTLTGYIVHFASAPPWSGGGGEGGNANSGGTTRPNGTGPFGGKTTDPVNPDDAGGLAVFAAAATAASKSVPKQIPQPRRGSYVHTLFEHIIMGLNGTNPEYKAEVSYLDRHIVSRGFPGSVRADGVYGDMARPQFIVELKTGNATVEQRDMRRYETNLPVGTRAYYIYVPPP